MLIGNSRCSERGLLPLVSPDGALTTTFTANPDGTIFRTIPLSYSDAPISCLVTTAQAIELRKVSYIFGINIHLKSPFLV